MLFSVVSLVLAASGTVSAIAAPQITDAPLIKRQDAAQDPALSSLSAALASITAGALTFTNLADLFSELESVVTQPAVLSIAATDATVSAYLAAAQSAISAEAVSFGVTLAPAASATPAASSAAAATTTAAASKSAAATTKAATSAATTATTSATSSAPSSTSTTTKSGAAQVTLSFGAVFAALVAGFFLH